MVAKRQAPFRSKYGVELGLRVRDRDPETGEVITATCLFCQLFGRESRPGAQRRPTDKVAVFKPPFRKDSIQIHHSRQHPTQWAEYCALSSDDSKRAFFIAAGASMELTPMENHEESGKSYKISRTEPNATFDPSSNMNSTSASPLRQALSSQPAESAASTTHWLVNRDIVTVLIGVMLPYAAAPIPAGQTYESQAVADFQDMLNESESRGDEMAVDAKIARFRIVIEDLTQFQQFVDYLSTSGSLVNSARMLQVASQPALVGPFFDDQSQLTPINVAKFARFLCAITFQRIADIARSTGIYSIGLKVAPIACASFFEAQVEYCLHLQLRVFVGGEVTSLHVLSVPLNKRRQSDADGSNGVFEIAEAALSAIVPRWQDHMLAVIADSDGIAAQEVNDPRLLLRNAVTSRFEAVAKHGFVKVCGAARQLDSLMQNFFSEILGGEELYTKLTALVAYVSRQRALLSAMKTKVPTISNSRWTSIASIAIWFRRHSASIREHLERYQVACSPPKTWWIRVILAARVSQEALPILETISSFTAETSDPRDAVVTLRTFLVDWFSISGPLEASDPAVAAATARIDNDSSTISKCGKFSVNASDVCAALEDLGLYIAEALRPIDRNDTEATAPVVRATVHEVAVCVVGLVSGLTSITINVTGIGATVSKLPTVLPQELVKIRGRQFTTIIRPQVERLRLAGWSRQEIEWIEQDFQDLCSAYFRETSLKLALESCANKRSFRDSWSCLQGRFTHLQRFCGLMATAYPIDDGNSDFFSPTDGAFMSGYSSMAPMSRIPDLPGDLKAGVSDLSVQAALQAKQFRRLQAMKL